MLATSFAGNCQAHLHKSETKFAGNQIRHYERTKSPGVSLAKGLYIFLSVTLKALCHGDFADVWP